MPEPLLKRKALTEAKTLREQQEFTTSGGCMSKRKHWTDQQDLFLMEHSHMGAEWCAKEISRQFGVRRSAEATQRHGTRIGCSWVRYDVCPECGKPILHMPKNLRMCRDCNIRRLRDKAKANSEKAVVNYSEDGNTESYARTKREYDMYRRRMSPRR